MNRSAVCPFCSLLFLFLTFSTSAVPGSQSEEWTSSLPPGEGRELLGALCTSCHDLQKIVAQRKDRNVWQQTVHSMLPSDQVEYITDELEIVVDYLAKYLGPLVPAHETLQSDPDLKASYTRGEIESIININTAPPDQLLRLPGITEILAEQIVEYRTAHGEFKSIEELKEMETVDDAIFGKLRELITVH